MVAVPVAVAVLQGPSRSRPLLPGELGLFLFPSALTAGCVPHGLADTQGLPPRAASAASAVTPLSMPPWALAAVPWTGAGLLLSMGAGDCLLLTS